MPWSRIRHLLGVLLGAAILAVPVGAEQSQPVPQPVRCTLRADWTHPTDGCWQGSVRLSAGRILRSRRLELHSGQCQITPSNDPAEVAFSSSGPSAWCGLELTIDAPADAFVELTLDGHRLVAPLHEILEGSIARMDWDGSARLRRDPAEIVGVRLQRPHVIYAPREVAQFELSFRLLTIDQRTLATRLQVALCPARELKPLCEQAESLQIPTNTPAPFERRLQLRMPEDEGVYDLVIRVEPAGLRPVERTVQLVVLDPEPPNLPRSAELVLEPIQQIDPSQPAGRSRWFSTRRMLPRTTRLGQFLWSSVRHPFGAPSPSDEAPANRYPLNVSKPGRPHLISIEYESTGTMWLAAAVTEQDPEGRWASLPVGSAIKAIEGQSVEGVQSHRFIFWPQSNSPELSLYVESPSGKGAVKNVQLYELPQGLPKLAVREPDGPNRLFGIWLDSPTTWQSFGSSRVVDASQAMPWDDWHTFLDTASRLADYAQYAGYNCAQVTVLGRGGALYPTQLVESNFGLDSGSLRDSAPDPIRKDVVELLLQIGKRNQLGLVLGLLLDGSIPALDQKLPGTDPRVSGLLLVSREGKVWDQPGGGNVASPRRYNPLHPEVQEALLEVIRELVDRYGKSVNFSGLALDLDSLSHVVLPGLDWGYDDHTMDRFRRESGVKFPDAAADSETRFADRYQSLLAQDREQWVSWRCRQLSKFYERVLAELQQRAPEARLILGLTTLSGSGTEDLREAVRQGRTVEDLLRVKGIDLRNWTAPRGLVVLRPFVATGVTPEGLHINSSRELEELMSKLPARGSLCIHEPELLPWESSAGARERLCTGQPGAVSLPLLPPGRAGLRRFAQSLASSDCVALFDGAGAVPLGQEALGRDFARVFRTLPVADFQSVHALQPLVVRSCRDPGNTIVYLLNEATYPVESNVSFECAAHTLVSNATTGERLPAQTAEGGISAKLVLEPFQTKALSLSHPEAQVAQCNLVVPLAAEKGLRARFERISNAMAVLGRDATRTLEGVVPNGEFEESGATRDEAAHWTAQKNPTVCGLDHQTYHTGKSSLRLSGPPAAAVLSEGFIPPGGRALAINVWLRADRPGLRLRWLLLGNRGAEVLYQCYADVPVKHTWEQKQFRARDLPEGLLENVQIRFELVDEGTVWIDDARVCALPISNDEQRAISKSVSAIVKAWKDRRLGDFERLADGYWATYLVESVEGSGKPVPSENNSRQAQSPSNM